MIKSLFSLIHEILSIQLSYFIYKNILAVNFEFPEGFPMHLVFHWLQPLFMWCICTTDVGSNCTIRHDYLRSYSMFKYCTETRNKQYYSIANTVHLTWEVSRLYGMYIITVIIFLIDVHTHTHTHTHTLFTYNVCQLLHK